VTWAGEAIAAIRKMVLIEDRMNGLSDQVKRLAASYEDLDRRLHRLEAKFEFIEHVGAARERVRPVRAAKLKHTRKKD
jgi:acyl carrier protein phosphodiesterase